MRAPARSANSSSHVDVTYSMSNGGSLRMTTALKSFSERGAAASAAYHSSRCKSVTSPVIAKRCTLASTSPPVHARCFGSQKYSVWPRRAASAIIA
jgi:hypothetical protein